MREAASKLCSPDLASRMIACEEGAFEEFYRVFAPRFLRYFIYKELSPQDAEDLAAFCIFEIAKKVEKYRPIEGKPFEAWVFTLAQHKMTDWFRARTKHPEITALTDELTAPEIANDSEEQDVDVLLAVQEALSLLSNEDQKIVLMHWAGSKLTYVEIGNQLGLQPNNVKVRLSRAKKKLIARLTADPRMTGRLQRIAKRY